MKKMTGILLAVLMGLCLICAGAAEEIIANMPSEGWVLDSVNGDVWQDDRASLEVFLEDTDNYKVLISWGSSAWETTEWVYACDYDAETQTLKARNLTCDNVKYDDAGNEERTVVYEYEASEATIALNEEGKLVIRNAGDEQLEGKTFENIGNPYASEEVPQPEGGKKFESRWALMGGQVYIDYEEVGYRVMIELYNKADLKGECWEYSCYYNEEKDALESVSSMKYGYTMDPEAYEVTYTENEYEGLDGEDNYTTFTINEDGMLIWADGHENAGADLQFQDIGTFEGVWRNEAEEVWTEIYWEGMDEEYFFYTVFIHRGGDEQYTEFTMQGLYNPETGKLEATGPAASFTRNADGGYDVVYDEESHEAFFSWMENGNLLFEAANGIELVYDEEASNPAYAVG